MPNEVGTDQGGGIVLNFKNVMASALVALWGSSLGTAPASAGVFDFLRPAAADSIVRAQSPAGMYATSPATPAYQPADGSAPASGGGPGWGYSPSACFNCGECDPHQGWVEFQRRQCHQTYYPRSAPYCQPDWGWHQSCWRRMNDNYNCPRPDSRGSAPSARTPPTPSVPVMPPAANPPASTWRQPAHAATPNRYAGYGRGPDAVPQADNVRPAPGARGQVLPGAASEAGPGRWTELQKPYDNRGPQFSGTQPEFEPTGYSGAPGYR
jgi:hypothetical protein